MLIRFKASALKRTSWKEYGVRFAFGGAITVLAGILAKVYGPSLGGLFLAFPAIFPATSTLIESHERQKKIEHGKSGWMRGRRAAAVDARGAMWGSLGLMCFAAFIWKLLPTWNAAAELLAALIVWILASIIFWRICRSLRKIWRRGTPPGAVSARG